MTNQQCTYSERKENLQNEIQGLSEHEAKEKELALLQAESEALRQKRHKISIRDFENVRLIGRGAFGEVKGCSTNLPLA